MAAIQHFGQLVCFSPAIALNEVDQVTIKATDGLGRWTSVKLDARFLE
jgi:hypothetical protein